MNRSRDQKHGARNRALSDAMWIATQNVERFLAVFDVTEQRGKEYRCPKCERFGLCEYPNAYAQEGHHFVCHRCETGKMDAVRFVMWRRPFTFVEAREWMIAYAKSVLANGETIAVVPHAAIPDVEQTRAFELCINALVAEAMPLRGSARAVEYLAARGLLEVCLDAGVRHLGDSTDEVRRVTGRALASVDHDDALLSGVWGLEAHAIESNGRIGFPFRSHNIVIPWPSTGGGAGTMRRRTSGPPPGDWPKYVMPAGAPHAPLPFMHPHDVARWTAGSHSTVVVAEGEFDALMLRRHAPAVGLPADSVVVACGGTGFVGWFRSHPTWKAGLLGKSVVLALDHDTAGMAASARCTADLRRLGLSVSELPRPSGSTGTDWAEVLAGG